jgi:putative iron-dependent peroxidase
LHIRADEIDLYFELSAQLLRKLGDAVRGVDEDPTAFDQRVIISIVDGA